MARPAPQRPGLIQRLGQSIAAAFAPSAAPSRLPVGARRTYAAAQQNRLTEGWTSVNYSANAELQVSLDVLRARSRQLCRDNPYARKFIALVSTNVVGPNGIRLQSRVYNEPNKPDQLANDAIEAAWARWGTQCDITRRHTFQSLSALLIKSAARDGELLLRIVRGKAAGNPFNFAVQALDVDRIDTGYNQSAGEGRPAIRMGVEVDDWGAPVALHLRTRQVNDPYNTSRATQERQRVPMDELIHAFVADRPEQLRGVPWMHAAMKDLNDLGGYREAAIVAARVGAAKMGFFTKAADAPEVQGAGQGEEDAAGNMVMDADAGTFETLPEGYKFEAFNPDYPTAMYESFVKATLRGISSGLGVAYHALSNDLEGVSFSSIRSGTLEERDQWADLQTWFIGAVLEPLFAEWLKHALAFGQAVMPNGSALPAGKAEKFAAHVFLGRRWEWVDPVRDIQADILAMEAGLMSPQAIVAKWAGDYEDTLVEIATAQGMREKLGVLPTKPGTSTPAPAVDPAAARPEFVPRSP